MDIVYQMIDQFAEASKKYSFDKKIEMIKVCYLELKPIFLKVFEKGDLKGNAENFAQTTMQLILGTAVNADKKITSKEYKMYKLIGGDVGKDRIKDLVTVFGREENVEAVKTTTKIIFIEDKEKFSTWVCMVVLICSIDKKISNEEREYLHKILTP